MKIIVGAGAVVRDGWLSLQHSDLDIRDARQWARLFPPASLDAILTEHTLEHLTVDETRAAIRNFYDYLKSGGYIRCAVPDGFHSEHAYINWVAPNSDGERWLQTFRGDESGHKTLWNYKSLAGLFVEAGFKVVLREWFDEAGQFNKADWNAQHGYVRRCYGSAWSGVLSLIVRAPYTSLLMDAIKF